MKSKETLFVSFSGGRTSAYMCHWPLNNKADEYDFIYVFANTGLEHEKTLEFVDRCDKEFGLNLVWVEAVVNPAKGKGTKHKIVDFKAASQKGEPFEDVIKKYGIPNNDYPHCNRDLKLQPIRSYKRSIGFKTNHPMAIGIRSDEIDRMSDKMAEEGLVYPLISWHRTIKEEVRHWWERQHFDLEIPEHYGNCVTCWKKSDRKLMTVAKHTPEYFKFFSDMERDYSCHGAGDDERKFFRKYRTTKDIISSSKQPFVEFVDHRPELQLKLLDGGFDIDELDKESSCGASCEVH